MGNECQVIVAIREVGWTGDGDDGHLLGVFSSKESAIRAISPHLFADVVEDEPALTSAEWEKSFSTEADALEYGIRLIPHTIDIYKKDTLGWWENTHP